ncbi:MAG: choice-of-anchor D domain-containing protein, partial [Myxococcota bacterium]
ELTIRNACDGVLELSATRIEGSDAAVFRAGAPADLSLGPGQETSVEVSFEPVAATLHRASLVLSSNDPAQPELTVELIGQGDGPRIVVSPVATDYGSPFIGCEQSQRHTLSNDGSMPLVIDEVQLFTESSDSFSLDLDSLTNGPLPFNLRPSANVDIYLDYLPLDEVPDSAFFSVHSNDPTRARVTVSGAGTGVVFRKGLDTFEQPLTTKTDILMTVDRSCSLDDAIRQLGDSTASLVAPLKALDADFHAAAVAGDKGCIVGVDPYVDASFSKSEAVEAFHVMTDIDRELAPYGSNEERGFAIAQAALAPANRATDGCNGSFYREDAFLSIVHMSDGAEESGYAWRDYVAWMQALKADVNDVRVHAIAGDYPSGCAGAAAGTGYYESTVATGGLFLSFCATDWDKHMEDLAAASVPNAQRWFVLTAQPVPQTLEVRIDGVLIPTGWAYDISSNSVIFDEDNLPPPGSTLDIGYDRLPQCEG